MARPAPPPRLPLRRQWTRRTSLTVRILAVNIIALGLMAGSLFYIDSYRKQLLGERFQLARSEAQIAAAGIAASAPGERRKLIGEIGADQHLRLRLYDPQGKLLHDSFAISGPAYAFTDPAADPWYLKIARGLDRSMNWVLGSADAGNLVVSAPAAAAIGQSGTINLTTTGVLAAGTKYLGSVAYGGAVGLPNPTIVRVDTP